MAEAVMRPALAALARNRRLPDGATAASAATATNPASVRLWTTPYRPRMPKPARPITWSQSSTTIPRCRRRHTSSGNGRPCGKLWRRRRAACQIKRPPRRNSNVLVARIDVFLQFAGENRLTEIALREHRAHGTCGATLLLQSYADITISGPTETAVAGFVIRYWYVYSACVFGSSFECGHNLW